MQCPYCKKRVNDKAVHCKYCGAKIEGLPRLEDFLISRKQTSAKYKPIKIIAVLIILVTLSTGYIWITNSLSTAHNTAKPASAQASEPNDVGVKTDLQQNIVSETYSSAALTQQPIADINALADTSKQPDTNTTPETVKQIATEVVTTDSLVVPDNFIGSWAEKENYGQIVNELKIERDRIEWIRQDEDKDLITKFNVEENGTVVSFDSKVTYSRNVFGGQAYKGEVKIKMKVENDILNLEVGQMKAQEQGILITMPPGKHLYTRQTDENFLKMESTEPNRYESANLVSENKIEESEIEGYITKQNIKQDSETSSQKIDSEAKKRSSENISSSNEKTRETLLKEGVVVLNGSAKINFVKIGIGEFDMGSQPTEQGNQKDERPVHRVAIHKPFYVSKYEITQLQYTAVLGNNPSSFKNDRCPVESVSWFDAQDFCRKLGELTGQHFRLPTEAEWEYTCRAGTSTSYYSGSSTRTLRRIGWCSYDGKLGSAKGPKPIGQFESNRWGLYDMHGNVSEWCQDWYSDYSTPSGEPNGPQNGTFRVVRGGSWYDDPQGCRSAARKKVIPDMKDNTIGFRIVCEFE